MTMSQQIAYDPKSMSIKKELELEIPSTQVLIDNFSEEALAFWAQYGITPEILQRYNVSQPQKDSLIFKYQLSNGSAKFYRPFAKPENDEYKFWWKDKVTGDADYVFGLDQLDENGAVVFITGGEKDVMCLAGQGINAVSLNSETAIVPKWLIKELQGRFKEIRILYDIDETGLEKSAKWAKEYGLTRGLLPSELLVLGGKDVSDLIQLGLSIDEIMYDHPGQVILDATLNSSELVQRYKDYQVSFILNPMIFKHGINILGAERGTGKTRFCIALSMAIIYERNMFLEYPIDGKGNVLFLNFEMHEPEFKLFVTPIERYYQGISEKVSEFYSISFLSYPDLTISQIELAIKKHRPVLTIIDSFKAFISIITNERKVDHIDNVNIRSLFFNPVNEWKRKYDTTILVTNHTNKGTKKEKSHSDLMFGPSGLMDYADHTFLLRKTNEPNQRLIVPDKPRFSEEGSAPVNLIEIISQDDILYFKVIEQGVNEDDYLFTGKSINLKEQLEKVKFFINKGSSQREIAASTGYSLGKVNKLVNILKIESRNEQDEHNEQMNT